MMSHLKIALAEAFGSVFATFSCITSPVLVIRYNHTAVLT